MYPPRFPQFFKWPNVFPYQFVRPNWLRRGHARCSAGLPRRFAGRSIYTLDPATGLIIEQRQTWAKSAATALQESFTPTFSPPSPV